MGERVEAACGVADDGTNATAAQEGAGVKAFRPGTKTAWIVDCGLNDIVKPAGMLEDARESEGERSAKRKRTDKTDGRQVHLFHVLKKHAHSRNPVTWRGEAVKITKGKAKLAIQNL